MFRFTIRDVLWLTLLIAALVAWWLDRTRLHKGAEADRKTVELYKRHKLDVLLEQILSTPPRPTIVVPVRTLPLDGTRPGILAPPPDRTPWIEKIERNTIYRETQPGRE